MQRFSQSPNDPDFVQNPYPAYDRMRSLGEIVFWDDYNMPCTTSLAATNAVLKSRAMGREVPEAHRKPVPDRLKPFYDIEAHSMLELEPPRHTRLRGLVLRAFTSRRIAALEDDIAALSRSLVEGFPDTSFDFIAHFAQPLPVTVIARLLGVPESAAPDLLRWSNAMVAMYQARRSREIEDAAIAATQDFSAFLTDYIAHRRAAPRDDLISTLIAAEEDGQTLSSEELLTTCILLLNAGHEATVHTLGNGLKALLEVDHREITPQTVEEILRYDPPLHMFTRHVYEEVEIAGVAFQPGDEIACLLGAAGRDPEAYPAPDLFDANRAGPKHAAFGAGIHFCVGAPLARLEIEIGLRELFRLCPNLTIAEPPRYGDVYHFHGLERLMVQA